MEDSCFPLPSLLSSLKGETVVTMFGIMRLFLFFLSFFLFASTQLHPPPAQNTCTKLHQPRAARDSRQPRPLAVLPLSAARAQSARGFLSCVSLVSGSESCDSRAAPTLITQGRGSPSVAFNNDENNSPTLYSVFRNKSRDILQFIRRLFSLLSIVEIHFKLFFKRMLQLLHLKLD